MTLRSCHLEMNHCRKVKNRTDAEKSQFAFLEKAELPPLFWEKPCIIKIDTYFQDFPNPLTQLKQLLF